MTDITDKGWVSAFLSDVRVRHPARRRFPRLEGGQGSGVSHACAT